MQALILAGGEGTRLRPLTSTVPKPVVPLVNRPFISYMIDWLAEHGIDDIVMSCGFLATEVRAVLGDGAEHGVRLRYVEEEQPLDTAGAVKLAEGLLDERFAVLNGDILADYNLSALQRFHAEHRAVATIALVPVPDPSAYGLVRTDAAGGVTGFLEKPAPSEIDTNLINAGAYILEREVLDLVSNGKPTSFEREVFPALVGSGLYGFAVEGYWLDIGTPERYLRASCDILEGRVRSSAGEHLGDDGLTVASDASIESEAHLIGPAVIGVDCELEAGAQVGGHAVIGDRCHIGAGAVVEHAVLHSDARLGPDVTVRDSVIASGVQVGAGSRIEGGAVIGAGAAIGPGNLLGEGARIDPGVELPEGAITSRR